MIASNIQKLPTLFVSHGGGPWPWMEWGTNNPYTSLSKYLRNLPQGLPIRPKALLVISAHWEEQEFTVMTHPQPPMLYDYYGFPEHTYSIRYQAPGSPVLAKRVRELLQGAGISSAEDDQRGFDHGTFVPLAVSFPEADIPVLQLSLKQGLNVQEHLALGKALEPLREEGVLIFASGLSYHNLREFNQTRAVQGAKNFDDWLTSVATLANSEERNQKLMGWTEAPSARQVHPREEHLIPILVAAGAAGLNLGRKVYGDQMFGMAVSGFQFG